jgi:hypothetical protein
MRDEDLENPFDGLPDIEVEFPEIPESELKIEFTEEDKKLLAEHDEMTRRWVDSGFKLGGHLSVIDKKKFDRWVLKTLHAAYSDPVAARDRVEKLMRLTLYNHRNIKRYRSWERAQKSAKARSGLTIPPLLIFQS